MPHHGPEYYLKKAIKEHLATLHRDGSSGIELPPPYVFMYVPFGRGKQTIDFLVSARKLVTIEGVERRASLATFLGIEAKAPGEEPTARQAACMREIEEAGGIAFWCDSFSGYLMNMHVLGFTPLPRGPQSTPECVPPRGKAAMITE